MTPNDGNDCLRWVFLASELLNKGLSTNDIKCSHTKKLLRVEDTLALEYLGSNGDSGVDWIGDDENVGFWTVFGDAFDKALDNACVDLEQVISGHAGLSYQNVSQGVAREVHVGLTRNASRDDADVCAGQSMFHAIIFWQVA